MANIHDRLKELGLTLPPAPKPVAAYIPCVQSGNHLFISGQLPLVQGKLLATGIVPSQVSLEAAQQAAGQCVLNALVIVGDALEGDWSRLVRIVKLGVFVACDAAYTEQAKVANGASELLLDLFGDPGRHPRVAVGMIVLPLDASVEVEVTFEV